MGVSEQMRAKHEAGVCTPCRYYKTKKGCANGNECTYCHLHSGEEPRARPCAARRANAKMRAAKVTDPAKGQRVAEYLLTHGSQYMQTVVHGKLRDMRLDSERNECLRQEEIRKKQSTMVS